MNMKGNQKDFFFRFCNFSLLLKSKFFYQIYEKKKSHISTSLPFPPYPIGIKSQVDKRKEKQGFPFTSRK